MSKSRVGYLVGSLAKGSMNRKLARALVRLAPAELDLEEIPFIPLVVAISTTLGARNGLLVRNRRGLEEARNVDTVFFDKVTSHRWRGSHWCAADGSQRK